MVNIKAPEVGPMKICKIKGIVNLDFGHSQAESLNGVWVVDSKFCEFWIPQAYEIKEIFLKLKIVQTVSSWLRRERLAIIFDKYWLTYHRVGQWLW